MNEVNIFLFITNLCVIVFCGVFLAIIPMLTRKSFLFGVKIPMEEHSGLEAKALKKRYITACLIGTAFVLAAAVAQYLAVPDFTLLSVMYFPLVLIAVQTAVYIPNWKRALQLKKERGWKVSGSVFAETKSSHSRGNLSELPWTWYIIGLIIALGTVVFMLVKYPGLPDRIPTHFDMNMQPDAWTDKSLLTVLMMPLINLGMLLLMWLVGFMVVRAKLQIDSANPTLSFAQHRIYRRRMGHGMGFLAFGLVVMFALIGVITVWPDLPIQSWLMVALPVVASLPIIIIPIKSGQGGCKIKIENFSETDGEHTGKTVSSGSPDAGRSDDKRWALGMFYHNPDDPAYIVEDRFGINFGFNYSRLPVKIGVVIGVLALVTLYVWVTVAFWPA